MERRKLWLSWIGELAPPRSTGKICTPSLQKIRPTLSKRRLYGTGAADPNPAIRLRARFFIREEHGLLSHDQLSNSAWIRNPSPSHRMSRTFGLQQTWQSST